MARIRTIKPEFFTSEDIVGLSMAARLLYIATWCEADKAGRLRWKPGTFKLRYFPGDDIDILSLCEELIDSGLVVLYGDGLAHVPKFGLHQHINPRESESSLPEPNTDATLTRDDASTTRDDASVTRREEGKGRERKEEKTLSGKPDEAVSVLEHLNAKSGKRYRPVEANLRLIRARLRESACSDVLAVIDTKAAEWAGTEYEKYLRPETLFRAGKFESYLGQLGRSHVPSSSPWYVRAGFGSAAAARAAGHAEDAA